MQTFSGGRRYFKILSFAFHLPLLALLSNNNMPELMKGGSFKRGDQSGFRRRGGCDLSVQVSKITCPSFPWRDEWPCLLMMQIRFALVDSAAQKREREGASHEFPEIYFDFPATRLHTSHRVPTDRSAARCKSVSNISDTSTR